MGDLETAIINDLTGRVVIDDLLIDAEGVPIDGVNNVPNILGQAGPTRFRRDDAASGAGLPVEGRMRFDSADLSQMEEEGSLLDVITHEMGHVLGIGTVWKAFGFLKNFPGSDPTFVGPGAMKEFAGSPEKGPPRCRSPMTAAPKARAVTGVRASSTTS